MHVEDSQLKAFILDAGLIAKENLKEAEKKAKETKEQLAHFLVKEKLITQEQLIRLEAYILGIPFVNLEKETIPDEILQIIPEPIARRHNIIAFRKKGRELEVAMLNPEDIQTIEFIKKKSDLKILPRLTNPISIKNALAQYQKTLKAEFSDLIKKEAEIAILPEKGKEESHKDLKEAAEQMPIIKIVETLLKHAILQQASDIHIEPLEKEVIVRYRIDGILHDAMTLPKNITSGVVARIKVLSNLKLDEHRLPQDGRFKIETKDYKISFRVSILPVYDGEKIVLRLLPEDAKGLTLEKLGLRGEALEKVHQSVKKPNGLILVTGPTGCGKTTALYTIMDILNEPGVNISSVEDPIEYRMPRINQTQVMPQIGLSFANGLRALVRQDPDIILVGEIRDEETAGLAINAALTGHLVLSTLHTNSAAGSFPRLIDMGAEPFLIASTTNIIIAKRLVRRLIPETKKKYTLSQDEIKSLEKEFDMSKILKVLKKEKIIKPNYDWTDIEFYRPGKTEKNDEGYKGRVGIFEVLEVSEAIKDLIVKEADADNIQEQAQKEGMLTMLEDGMIKAAQGLTSIEEILRVTKE
ncbi:Flp pilus assembly complex ATPase component TadA [Patescibacteria group bacterium]|nr:Flp pilus assembly complex ATPase component TadA [Patescibacteria group bacterium]MBU2579688.1 Flp pilus assembly complex ATPase component TadA [Patescibacteria group bacterium]